MDSLRTMKKTLRRGALAALACVASVALLLASAGTGPAQAADPGQGDVVLEVVDPSGAQLGGQYYLIPAGSDQIWDVGTEQVNGLTPTVSLPVGGYGAIAISPWGGFVCAGVSPCSASSLISSVPVTVTPAIQITDQGTTTQRFEVPATAQVVGGNTAGSARTIEFSAPMADLLSVYTLGIYGGVNTTWLRNGVPITGAELRSYTLTAGDVGKTIAPRVSWSGYLAQMFLSYGLPSSPRTLPGVAVRKSATRTTVQVFRRAIPAGTSTGFRADVTSGSQPATGKVKIRIGKVTMTKTLRNGSVRGLLPKSLKPGKYQVRATYAGTSLFLPSQGKDKITVQPSKK